MSQLTIFGRCDAHHMRTDTPGYIRSLNSGHSFTSVGNENCEVVRTDDRRSHISNEMHIEAQLNQSYRKVLTDQSRPSGPIDEDGLLGKDEFDKVPQGLRIY